MIDERDATIMEQERLIQEETSKLNEMIAKIQKHKFISKLIMR